MTIIKLVSEYLEEYRKEQKHNKTVCSEKLGVSVTYYNQMIEGMANPSLKVILAVIQYTGVEILIHRKV